MQICLDFNAWSRRPANVNAILVTIAARSQRHTVNERTAREIVDAVLTIQAIFLLLLILTHGLPCAVRHHRSRLRISTFWACSLTEHVHCRFRTIIGQCQHTKMVSFNSTCHAASFTIMVAALYALRVYTMTLSVNSKHVAKPRNQVIAYLKTSPPVSSPS